MAYRRGITSEQLRKHLSGMGYTETKRLKKKELLKLNMEHEKGGSIFSSAKEVYNRVKGFLTGARRNAPPQVREFLEKYGESKINQISVCRIPVHRLLTSLLNTISFGTLFKKLDKYDYDDLYHLFLVLYITTPDGKNKVVKLEKNHVVEIKVYNNPKTILSNATTDCLDVNITSPILMKIFIGMGEQYQGDNFWIWTPTNNCQVFVNSLLKGNNLSNSILEKFVSQCVKCILGRNEEEFATKVVNLAQRADILFHGAGYGSGFSRGHTITYRV